MHMRRRRGGGAPRRAREGGLPKHKRARMRDAAGRRRTAQGEVARHAREQMELEGTAAGEARAVLAIGGHEQRVAAARVDGAVVRGHEGRGGGGDVIDEGGGG
eukprot:2824097-Prymnesium_polylepis.1